MNLLLFKPIPNFERYYISKNGQIFSNHKHKMLKPTIKNGYQTIGLSKDNVVKYISVSRLVAMTYIPNPNKYPIVNHINENKLDNRVQNLEWCTQKHNVLHSQKSQNCHKRTVRKFSKNKILLEIYPSVKEAAKSVKLTSDSIVKVCRKKNKTAGGFYWEYAENYKCNIEIDNFTTINGFENYLISKNGEIFSKKRKKMLKHCLNHNGQHYVTLCKSGKKKNIYVQQLVAKTYLKNIDNKMHVRHKDGDKNNNNYKNLEWF